MVFVNSGIWNPSTFDTNPLAVENLPFYEPDAPSNISLRKPLPSVQTVINSYKERYRCLLRPEEIDDSGTIRVDTTSGALLRSDDIIEALRMRAKKRLEKEDTVRKKAEMAEIRLVYPESKEDLRQLLKLSPEREIRKSKLKSSRRMRRFRQTVKCGKVTI